MALAEQIRQDIADNEVAFDNTPVDTECPDCHTAMTQYYDWDVLQYICENCGTDLEQGFSQEY